MQDSQSQDKPCWTREMLHIYFVTFISKQLRKGYNRTHILIELDENMLSIALKNRSTMH
jgi:hypothetical protein